MKKYPSRSPEYQAAYRLKNRDRIRSPKKAWYHNNKKRAYGNFKRWQVRTLYGLTMGEYSQYLDTTCPICEVHKAKHLDHCHATGIIRGGLCGRCNQAIGLLADSPIRLRKAAQYLEAHANEKSQQQAGSNQPVIIAVG